MRYLILEQKYFELIEDNRHMDALQCLRHEIQGLKIRIERTHELTTSVLFDHIEARLKNQIRILSFSYRFRFLMFNSIKDMYKAANWDGKGLVSRQKLMEKLQSKLKQNEKNSNESMNSIFSPCS